MTQRRIKVRATRRRSLDVEQLAYVYWILGKQAVRERREREQQERKARETTSER